MKEKYISSALNSCNTCMVSFDLWMFRTRVDTFVLILHFLDDKWDPCHVTIGFFEIVENFEKMPWLCNSMKSLQNTGLMFRLLRMLKKKGGNISTMTTILTFVVSCEVLGLITPFVGACHV
jgi:hypothetical protein